MGGKRLSQLNRVEQVNKEDYLLIDGEDYLESKKIKLKDIKLENFNTENFYNKEQINGNFIKKEKNKTLSTNDFTDDDKKKLDNAQEQLISGKNVKTINGESILGSGDLQIVGGQFGLIKVVDKLPETGLENRIYLIPKPQKTYKGYNIGTDNSMTFDGISKCSITIEDESQWLCPTDYISILTSDGGSHLVNSYDGGGWKPLYECNVEGSTLSVTLKMLTLADGEIIDWGVQTIPITDGALITGLSVYSQFGETFDFTVSFEDLESNNLFDEYIWVNKDWEYIGAKTMEIDLDSYATKEYVDQEIATFDSIYATKEYVNQYIEETILGGAW